MDTMKLFAIVPTHCQELHQEGDPDCWCHPRMEKHDSGYVLVHFNPVGGFGELSVVGGTRKTQWFLLETDTELIVQESEL